MTDVYVRCPSSGSKVTDDGGEDVPWTGTGTGTGAGTGTGTGDDDDGHHEEVRSSDTFGICYCPNDKCFYEIRK